MQNNFSKAMKFRHACKIFDENRKISDEEMRFILEAGRGSPSSFGQELWKFVVITNNDLKAKIRPHCWNQIQITSSSHLVVILSGIRGAKVSSGRVEKMLARRGMGQDKLASYINLYQNHLQDTLADDEKIFEWTARQSYIAMANMMTAAAYIGIDSCAIEGMDPKEVEKILDIDTNEWRVSVLVPFGYRVKEQPQQLRLAFDEVVEFIR